MSVKTEIITVGLDKNGQAEFGISGNIYKLTPEMMNELRAMAIVAIGTMEDMWRRRPMAGEAGEAQKQIPDNGDLDPGRPVQPHRSGGGQYVGPTASPERPEE